MVKGVALMRMAEKLSAYIDQYVTIVKAQKQEEVFELFDKMHLFFPHWVIATCPVMHPDIHYISKNYPFLFGQDKNYLINTSATQFFMDVHPADQEDLHTCLNFAHGLLESVVPEHHCQYRLVFHYRYQKKNGQYMYLQDEKAVLHLRESGNLYYALFCDVSADKKFSGVKVEVFKQEETLNKVAEYKPSSERTSLSKREGELVTLIKQGLSTKEIAWYLNISHHTVRNIKSKLFEKYKVSNTVELLNMTT